MQLSGAATRWSLLGRKRKTLEMMNAGATIPSEFPKLATRDNPPTSFPTQEVEAVQEHRAKRNKQEEITVPKRRFEPTTAAPPAKSSVPPEPTCPTLQARDQGPTVGWSTLPPDLEEQILRSVPLLELVRRSRTCRAFSACVRKRVAEQEEARSDMAARCFGREWISFVAGLVDRYLKGEPLGAKLEQDQENLCCFSADGLLEVEERTLSNILRQRTNEARRIRVRPSPSAELSIDVPAPNLSSVNIRVCRENRVQIYVLPARDEDVEGIAFVQALLTWGFAPSFRDAHPHVEVKLYCGRTSTLTAALAQILPLVALASRHKWLINLLPHQVRVRNQYFLW